MSEFQMTIWPAPARRVIACGMMVAIGGIFWWMGATTPDMAPSGRALMAGIGALAMWVALEIWRATAKGIALTPDSLRDTSGHEIVRLDDILSMDRGVFAVKPSNGVLIKTGTSGQARWSPGLWWRLGYRVGIGGMTAKHETKALAEALEAILAARKGSG